MFAIAVGPIETVIIEASRHSIASGVTFQVNPHCAREVFLSGINSKHWNTIANWFCEDLEREAPYPPGSILFYNNKT